MTVYTPRQLSAEQLLRTLRRERNKWGKETPPLKISKIIREIEIELASRRL